ncbi:N2227-like protein-domain-containing protein [Colletotrichum acutatum]|uniref:N2227-like protein-domain-containing protein n=1 Tax=Glomerella acutata TaxID=27357 RepID=A0AAD8UHG2_GLOAC|nr:N2227-like protein-domain-containing protein [Colletotrichum acutatum]KAK1723243.1 N2227-like protein-domain-containing protein [Colletotrichum acutatum]
MRLSQVAFWAASSLAYGVLSVAAEADSVRNYADNGVVLDNELTAQEILAAMPEESFVEIHEVTVTVEDIPDKPSPRHEQEKKNLLKRLSKSHGKWDTNHPRHRLLEALFGFSRYKARQMAELDRWKGLYKHVSKAQKAVLEKAVGYSKKFETAEELLNVNQALCDEIVETALEFYGISRKELDDHAKAKDNAGQPADRVSTSQALKHFVRDWSTAGRGERDDAFPCILGTLNTLFPDRSERGDIKVLLPGAGAGRLGHEISALGGFEVTSNEWSMFMNLAYRFLESHTRPASQAFHPFVEGWSHHATAADMFRQVSFPDRRVNASAVLLVEGDFASAFKSYSGQYDVVVTHFFLDTARNVMSYFDTINSVLKPGGYWVNFGPLMWGTGPFVQLSLDEVIAVTKNMGFEFLDIGQECGEVTFGEEKVRSQEAVYGFNERALTKNAYSAQSWLVRKSR